MSSSFSPTGYWAHYLLTKEFVNEVNSSRPPGGERMRRDQHLPVVTWTPDGSAAVFDSQGNLTAVGSLYPGFARYVVDASPNWED